MDKAQKQLFDTYLRKRKIAINSVNDQYKEYELIYLLNNYHNINTGLFNTDLILFIRKFPQLFNKLSDYELNSLYKTNSISSILYDYNEHGNSIILNSLDLNKVSAYDLKFVLYYAPKFIEKIDVNKINNVDMEWILSFIPKLINYFDLSKLNIFNIYNILNKQPQLKSYFKDYEG